MAKITLKCEPHAQSTFSKKRKQICNINSHSLGSNGLEHFAEKEMFFPHIEFNFLLIY